MMDAQKAAEKEMAKALEQDGLSSAFFPLDQRAQTAQGLWPGSALLQDTAKLKEAMHHLSKCLVADTYGGVDAVRWARDAYNNRSLVCFFFFVENVGWGKLFRGSINSINHHHLSIRVFPPNVHFHISYVSYICKPRHPMHLMVDMETVDPDCGGKLWLGGEVASTDVKLLEENGVTILLPASRKPVPAESLNLKIMDYVDGTALANGDYAVEKFLRVSDQVISHLHEGHGVLVSCRNGAHRSATEVCLLIMRMTGWSFERSQAYVSTLRNGVDLNSVPPRTSHRTNPIRPSEFLKNCEAQILAGTWNLQLSDVVTPVAYRKRALELGFESVSAGRPKSKAKAMPKRLSVTSGESSFEMVSDVDSKKPDTLGAGTTLESSGSLDSSSSAASGPVRQKRSRVASESEFSVVADELGTKEKRAAKLESLCLDLQSLNDKMLGLLTGKPIQPTEEPIPQEKEKVDAKAEARTEDEVEKPEPTASGQVAAVKTEVPASDATASAAKVPSKVDGSFFIACG